MRLQKSGAGFWVSVPKKVIESKGWQKGDILYPIPIKNGIQFVKMEKNDD